MFRVKGSKSRVVSALELEEPDMLPIFELGITPPISSKIIGRTPYYRNPPLYLEGSAKGKKDQVYRRIAEDQIECHRRLGLDAIRVKSSAPYIPVSKVRRVSENVWKIGDVRYQYLPETNVLWQLDSVLQNKPEEVMEYIREHWSETVETEEASRLLTIIVREVGDEMFIMAETDGTFPEGGPGLEKLLIWMYMQPDLIQKFTNFNTRRAIALGKALIDAGADAIFMGADYAHKDGPLMSPKLFRQFILPALKKQVDAFHKKGAFAIKHTDGNIKLLLDDLVRSGIDGLQGIDPTADMDIGEVKQNYGDQICLLGNIDVASTLTRKSVDEVAKETKECIEAASPGGGYVLCSANVIHVKVKLENFLTMIKTARKYGKYPVKQFSYNK